MLTTQLRRGMRVYGRDGVDLGYVVETWADTPAHGRLAVSRHLLQDYGPVRGTDELFQTSHGELQVRQGDFLGFGGRDLWVPFSAVRHIEPGSTIELTHSAAECEAHFTRPLESARAAA